MAAGKELKLMVGDRPNGYLETIQKGIRAVKRFRGGVTSGEGTTEEKIARLESEIADRSICIDGDIGEVLGQ